MTTGHRLRLGATLLATLLASGAAAPARAAGPQVREGAGPGRPPVSRPAAPTAAEARTRGALRRWKEHNGARLERSWGVDVVGVHPIASGYMLRFDYRVLEPSRAQALHDRQAKPYVLDEKSHTALAVPAMENIGELRQVAPVEEGRTYYVMFGNPGRLVRPGDKVTVVIGNFRAEGLVVN